MLGLEVSKGLNLGLEGPKAPQICTGGIKMFQNLGWKELSVATNVSRWGGRAPNCPTFGSQVPKCPQFLLAVLQMSTKPKEKHQNVLNLGWNAEKRPKFGLEAAEHSLQISPDHAKCIETPQVWDKGTKTAQILETQAPIPPKFRIKASKPPAFRGTGTQMSRFGDKNTKRLRIWG